MRVAFSSFAAATLALTACDPAGNGGTPSSVVAASAKTVDAAATSSAPDAFADAVSSAAPLSSASAHAETEPTALPAAHRGLWIWDFAKNAPSPERAAELAASFGVGRVFIKGNNGNMGDRWAANASAANLAPFLERGIEVWLFGYFYPPDVADQDGRKWGELDEQVEAAMRVASHPGVAGFVVDAEEEFKGHARDATLLCNKLRARLGAKKLAFTSYGWISRNSKFPFAELDRGCGDAFLPQVYYAFGWPGDVAGSLDRLDADLQALSLRAPIWPVQSNERAPSAARMNAFFARTGPNASIFYLHRDGTPQTAELAHVEFR